MYNSKPLTFIEKFSNRDKELIIKIFLFAFLLIITAYRIWFISLEKFDLYADEAQYFGWSQELAWGYYSKPPMIAWVIHLFTNFCGNSEFCIRLPAPILHLLISFVIIMISHSLYRNVLLSLVSAVVYLTLPAVTLSSALMTTDTLLLFFWSLSLYLFLLVLRQPSNFIYWVLASIFIGLGCLSKYNMIIFLPSALLYIVWSKEYNVKQFILNYRFWCGVAIIFLIYLPNLLWNIENHFVSYNHTKDISNLHRMLIYPKKLLEFWGAQIIIFGPFTLYLLLGSLRSLSEQKKLLLSFIIPFFVIISLLSLIAGAFANWAAPIYISATIQAAAFAFYAGRKYLLTLAIILHLFIAVIFYNYHNLAGLFGVELTASGQYLSRDPFKKLKGWSELGHAIANIQSSYPGTSLLLDDRKLLAELNYYVQPRISSIYKWNSVNNIRDHYDLTRKINTELLGSNFIFITMSKNIDGVLPYFKEVRQITKVSIKLYEDLSLDYYVYYLEQLRRLP